MNWLNALHSLQFDQQAVLDKNVEPKTFFKNDTFVFDYDLLLFVRTEPSKFQFVDETLFVDALEETWSECPVNLDSGSNRFLAQCVSFCKVSVHKLLGLNRRNEGHKVAMS